MANRSGAEPSDKALFRLDREEASAGVVRGENGGSLDLRSQDISADRDRAAHRRATWLYDDLLN